MDCLVHLAALCLFDPSNVFLSATYEHPLSDDNRMLVGNWRFERSSGEYVGEWKIDRFYGDVDYGRIELGWHIPVGSQLNFSIALAHRSLLYQGGDRGQESVSLGFTWRPFQ